VRRLTGIALAVVILASGGCTRLQQFVEYAKTRRGHVVVPKRHEPQTDTLARLQTPPGFDVHVFASGLGKPRMMAVAGDGTVYVTRRAGDVVALVDADGDGRAERTEVALADLPGVHGIAIHENAVYLADHTRLWKTSRGTGIALPRPTIFVEDLPPVGQHANRTLAVGPDGRLYVSIGSTCNACEEERVESATIQRTLPEGGATGFFAAGLRNTVGFGWHPVTGEMWGMDNGADWRGDEQPPEELNRLVAGADYGWPYCYGDRQVDRFMKAPAGECAKTEAPVLTYQAHSAPLAMVFYTGSLFPDAHGDAFVAMHGSWNRKPPTGYKVVRLRFKDGQPVAFEDFLWGFLADDGRSHVGRPAGLAVARDGALLVSDDANGVVYRVAVQL
jgi:glucose/arabinose dehydrogenase